MKKIDVDVEQTERDKKLRKINKKLNKITRQLKELLENSGASEPM